MFQRQASLSQYPGFIGTFVENNSLLFALMGTPIEGFFPDEHNDRENTFLNELRVYLGLKCGFCKLYILFVYILPKFIYYTIF